MAILILASFPFLLLPYLPLPRPPPPPPLLHLLLVIISFFIYINHY